MNCSTGNKISDQIAEINITGNVIPSVWFKTIVNDKGKPNLLAIMILSEIVYWYRPVEVRDKDTGEFVGYRTKFKQDILQKSYKDLAEYYQVSKRQVTDAIIALENLGAIDRDFRTITKNGVRCNNVLFIRLNPDKIRELTYPHDNESVTSDAFQVEKEGGENVSSPDQGSSSSESEKEYVDVDYVDKDKKRTPLSRKNGIGSLEKTGQPITKFRETNTENTNDRLSLYNLILSHHLPRDECIKLFTKQISYDAIRCQYKDNQCALDVLDQCVEIAGNVLSSKKTTFRLSGEDMSAEYVFARLSKLNIMHMEYVLDSFLSSGTKVKKIQNYLLVCMINSISSFGVRTANDLVRNGYYHSGRGDIK